MLKKIQIRFNTSLSLGIRNIINVLLYRLQCKTGYFQKRLPQKLFSCGNLFYITKNKQWTYVSKDVSQKIFQKAETLRKGRVTFFSQTEKYTGNPPNWFFNPFSNKTYQKPTSHWSSPDIANETTGDIKIIWEMSRMDWALILTKSHILSGNKDDLYLLNNWINDWLKKNPPQTGPNWMCGQETAIRLIQIILCGHILNQQKPLPMFIEFVKSHCERIELTQHYAKAQNNNHATSEAAGLFIGGLWLNFYASDYDQKRMGIKWQKQGRKHLEKMIQKLISHDGSFSQNSLNYHRVLIATLNMAEYFRKIFHQKKFTASFYQKGASAVLWLFQMIDSISGQGPNLGANDGARLYPLSETPYDDYRPDIQLGACLYLGKRLYKDGPWDETFHWLQIDSTKYPNDPIKRTSQVMSDGGYVTFSFSNAKKMSSWAMVRCPNNRFRPHHADALHFDFWLQGLNILRDSGSFSYGQDEPLRTYFISSSAHNTIAFDSHDQMPVISKFLFGQWIKTKTIQPFYEDSAGIQSWCGEYTDYFGCRHQRHISTDGRKWSIKDKVEGFKHKAVLRWRLINGPWILKENCLQGEQICIQISTNVQYSIRLTEGLESLCYMKKQTIPVLEISIKKSPATVQTELSFS
ncbi:heparinase II/III [Candidatus Magnetomorum sp. HK-1]|nr:heparinase II/III [Candidatus Magnetomorum sp. HK-1]